jgi:hypothetical protein
MRMLGLCAPRTRVRVRVRARVRVRVRVHVCVCGGVHLPALDAPGRVWC